MTKLSDASKLFIITAVVFVSVYIYRNYFSNEDYSVPKYITFKKSIIENATFKNNTDDSGKLKQLAQEITAPCNHVENCEIESIYKYVTKIPYYAGDTTVKTPVEVLSTNSGDCDEKSFLMATLLKEKKHTSVLIFTKQNETYHTFLGVAIKNDQSLNHNSTFLKVGDQKYYYAETTQSVWEIGDFNGVEQKDIVGIYDVENNKNISLKKVELVKNS
ncbi:MAG: hypothetical protein PHW18_04550 [Sulfuricurvum sp.]|uniref:hypothetical protein n=1 Tax=Sulfuricurvum sp. TaxID=2025608 RepID=UPI0026054621|nr:hypothetical protein [Sulfuricurvum sp.]MDD2828825.1 hypothetical protein [Sulfuricurvum sp.]MDD4948716.1 hypothetical protein [Sulfuricurvum sp.]